MRMIVLLVAAIFATSLSFYASAHGSKGLSFKAPMAQNEHPEVGSNCVRKITTASGEVIGCHIQRRKGHAA